MMTYDEPAAQRFLQVETIEARDVRGAELRHYLDVESEDVRVVAVKGRDDDWAAYADTNRERDPLLIAAHGWKLPEDLACKLFPVLNPARYRP